jgi:hypothetical protein
VTVSLFVRQDPLEFTPTSYGTLPSAYGALHDLFALLDVPVERSFADPDALDPQATVWWIEPERICAKLPAAVDAGTGGDEEAEPDPVPRDWDLAPWIRTGGTAVVFASGLADCEAERRIGELVLPAPRLPGFRGAKDEAEDETLPEESDDLSDGIYPRADWAPQQITGPIVGAPRSLPVPTLATFDEVPEPFSVVAVSLKNAFAVEAPLGAGRLVLVADSVFLRNLWLDAGDAAPLAFDWLHAYGVPRLDEREHGLSDTPSATAYLVRSPALPVFAGLAASGLLFGWAGATLPRRRIGETRPAPPTLRTYVDSLARLYARAGDHGEVFERYRDHALARLRDAMSLAHDASTERVQERLRAEPRVANADIEVLGAGLGIRGAADLRRACDAIDRLLEATR